MGFYTLREKRGKLWDKASLNLMVPRSNEPRRSEKKKSDQENETHHFILMELIFVLQFHYRI
ncbi:hypothetical protein D3C74_427820 [compost metagenome]